MQRLRNLFFTGFILSFIRFSRRFLRRHKHPARNGRSVLFVSSFHSDRVRALISPRDWLPTSLRRSGASRSSSKTDRAATLFSPLPAVLSAHDDHVLLFAPASTFTAHTLAAR